MPKKENYKAKTFYIAECFKKESDENHPITFATISTYLQDHGIDAEDHSIYRDISFLIDNGLLNIEKKKGSPYYRLLDHDFSYDDLFLLAECVHAARFISEQKAKKLIHTLSLMGSRYQAEQLEKEVFLCDRLRTTNSTVFDNLKIIREAMSERKDGRPRIPTKINFKYTKFDISNIHRQVDRRKGATYTVSPYAVVINDGYYYMIAFSDRDQEIRNYRVDRMRAIINTVIPRDGEASFKEINVQTYTKQTIGMFRGKSVRVTIQFISSLLGTVIDRFGTRDGVSYHKIDEHHFTVSTDIQLSDQFYGWVAGFRKNAIILSPQEAVDGMKEFIGDIASKY